MGKDYYRLNEIERYFGITQDDILYLAEKGEIQLALSCPNEKFVVGAWYKSENSSIKFIGAGVVEYRGLIGLQTDDCKELLDKRKVSLTYTRLLQRELIRYCSNKYPYKIDMPNVQIASWQPTPLTDLNFKTIAARVLHKEIQNPARLLVDLADTVTKISKDSIDYTSYLPERLRVSKNEIPDLIFEVRKLNFMQDDIRILHQTAIDAVALLKSSFDDLPLEPVLALEGLKDNQKKSRSNDLHELIADIISNVPSISAKGVWAALEQELAIDEGDRKYDTYNILRDMSATELLWESRYGHGGTFKFSSLGTTVSKIRKKLNTN